MSTNLTTTTSTTSTSPTTTTSVVQAVPQTPQPASSSSLLDVLQSIFFKIIGSDTTTSTSSNSLTPTTSVVQAAPDTSQAISLSSVPYEVLYAIFSNLNRGSIYSLILTDRRISYYILGDPYLWKTLLQSHFPSSSLNQNVEPIQLYKKIVTYLNNVRTGNFKKEVIDGHQEQVRFVSAHSGKLASYSSDDTIIIWDVENENKKLKSITNVEHVYSGDILVHENKLFFRENQSRIRVVDINAGKELYTINQNLKPCLANHGFLLCRTLEDYDRDANNNVKIFEVETGAEIITIPCGIGYRIWDLNVSGTNLFVSLGHYDKEKEGLVRVFDLASGQEINVFQCKGFIPGIMASTTNELFCTNRIGLGRETTTIVSLDTKTGEKLKEIPTDEIFQLKRIFPFEEMGMLVLCSTNGNIAVFDIKEGKIIHIIHSVTDRGSNCSMAMSNNKLFLQKPCSNSIEVFDFASPSSADVNQPVIEEVEDEEDGDLGLFSFLVDFGIASRADISNKLKCTPKDLQILNIVSEQDLSSMGICCSNIEKLPSTMVIPNNGAPLSELHEIQQTHGQANSRHGALSSFLKKLVDQIDQRIAESCNKSELYGDNNPWFNLFKECDQYRIMFYDMEHQSAKDFLKEFSAEGYQAKAKFINDCVDRFNALDKEHQIAKLRVYIKENKKLDIKTSN